MTQPCRPELGQGRATSGRVAPCWRWAARPKRSRAFECALRIDPASAHIRSCLAKAKAGLPEQPDVGGADTAAHKLLGNQAYGREEFSAAIGHYTAAIELCGSAADLAVLHSNRSASLLSAGAVTLAVADGKETIRHDPTFWKGYARLGEALLQAGDWQGALDAFRDGLECAPENTSLRNGVIRAAKAST